MLLDGRQFFAGLPQDILVAVVAVDQGVEDGFRIVEFSLLQVDVSEQKHHLGHPVKVGAVGGYGSEGSLLGLGQVPVLIEDFRKEVATFRRYFRTGHGTDHPAECRLCFGVLLPVESEFSKIKISHRFVLRRSGRVVANLRGVSSCGLCLPTAVGRTHRAQLGGKTLFVAFCYIYKTAVVLVGLGEILGVIVGDQRGFFQRFVEVPALPAADHIVVVAQGRGVLFEGEVAVSPVVEGLQFVCPPGKFVEIVGQREDGLVIVGILELHFGRPEV